jgi:alkaline phosphatase D
VSPQRIFEVASRASPDLFVFGGDNHYADSPRLDALWGHLRAGLEHPARAALVASTPTLAIWDDHDFVGNDSDGTWSGKETALRAFEDYWANGSLGTPTTRGVFSAFRWGDVEIFLLDVRYHRSPPHEEGGSLLGAAQTAWLEERLAASRATFKLLVSGTIWSPGRGETWLDHEEARDRLFEFLRARSIEGVVLLAGDLHRVMLRRIPRDGAYPLPEIVSSPLATPRTWRCPPPSDEVEEIACWDGGNAVAILDLDTTLPDPRIDVRVLDEAGADVARMTIRRSELR